MKTSTVTATTFLLFCVPFCKCDFSGFTELRWGKRLNSVLIDTVYRVSFLDCVEECIARKRCRSVNYQRKHLLCELNYLYSIPFKNPSSEMLSRLKDDESFVFTDISSWDKRIARSCSSQPCPGNEKCVRKSSTQYECKVSDCGSLQDQENATEVVMKTSIVKIGEGARRIFTCTSGYQPYNVTSTLICTSDGEWLGVRLNCIACGSGCFVPASPPLYNNDIYVTYIGENLLQIPLLSLMDHSWLVIQRRINGTELFYRPWRDYKAGFGSVNLEFWIGNDNLHFLTSQGYTQLRIELEDHDDNKRYAEYSEFRVSDESKKYKLTVDGYNGDAGDSMERHNGLYFSTYDRDNDLSNPKNCADICKGGWWYRHCHQSNLNGEYGNNKFLQGINWNAWRGFTYSLKSVTMAIRKP